MNAQQLFIHPAHRRLKFAPGRCRPGRRAFTLVEVLMVVAIFAAVAGALFISFIVSRSSYNTSDAFVQVQQEARQALDTMGRELRAAGDSVAGTITPIGSGTFPAPGLQFQLPLGYNLAAPCPADAVCWGAVDQNGVNQPGWFVRYARNGTQLSREIRDVGAGLQSSRVLANNISQISFTYDANAKTVQVALAAQITSAQVAGGTVNTGANPLTTIVKIRN